VSVMSFGDMGPSSVSWCSTTMALLGILFNEDTFATHLSRSLVLGKGYTPTLP
jgi:hypothetical protein